MAKFSCACIVVLCLIAVDAFPNARRSGQGKAFVVYRMPQRCVDAPQNDICDLDYQIRNVGEEFNNVLDYLSEAKSSYQELELSEDCFERIMKLLCRNVFPECLPDGELDYGDQHGLIDQIDQCNTLTFDPFNKSHYSSGVKKDPHPFLFECEHAPQDEKRECPKPEYAMPVASIEEYYERIENTSRDMAADIEDAPPEECRKKAFNLFACSSYAFCSEDRKALLVKTSREDCEDIGRCLEEHDALNDEAKKFLEDTCPKFPSPDKYEQVELPY